MRLGKEHRNKVGRVKFQGDGGDDVYGFESESNMMKQWVWWAGYLPISVHNKGMPV
jgi:hypothetical protein